MDADLMKKRYKSSARWGCALLGVGYLSMFLDRMLPMFIKDWPGTTSYDITFMGIGLMIIGLGFIITTVGLRIEYKLKDLEERQPWTKR